MFYSSTPQNFDIAIGAFSSFVAYDIVSNSNNTSPGQPFDIMQVVIPVVTGVLIPLLNSLGKELVSSLKSRRARKARKARHSISK